MAQPELRRRPLVLHIRDGSRSERVVLASPAAWQCGVRPDMPVAEAETLVQHHSRGKSQQTALSLLPHDPASDRETLENLANWCEQFSPLVGLEDAAEPTSLLLDITGLALLFGPEQQLLAKIAQQLRERGYQARLGLGETIGQAWAMASHGVSENDQQIPNPKSQIPNCSPLPPAALRLPGETLDLLDELGITTIGQLQALPRSALASRFGDVLARRLNQFEGKAKEVIIAHHADQPFTASWSLEHPTDKSEVVDQVLEILVGRLCGQLDEQNRGAVQVECHVRVVDRHEHQQKPTATEMFTLGLYQPTACDVHLLQLLHLQWEGRRWPGLVSDIRLQAVTTAPLEVKQAELFPDQQRERQRKLALLVDRLSSRLGRDRVLSPTPHSDALPERAVEYAPAVEQRSKVKQSRKKGSSRAGYGTPAGLSRPLQLYDPPIPVEALAVVPDGPPRRFQFHRWRHNVVRQWGPERIETSWWRGRTIRRDYWRVETESGGRFWLFRRQEDGHWFLHGEFV